ncbi:TetR/AcrR family transcriptional regulator [Paenibacillus tritici]|uniref:TetR/AcrR family transcriptional regulator n=1 Tax=Paenibacillus tritici TaxID=1873425 RepID=A0ABX2DTK0_9BACL|nr:TetR/AcrR family transcriptional regulator [Paenibacillus tritici]NQX46761.1 TetR/AcrR family transcriptional regulator [Paenibacillus tritici]
MRTEKVDLRIIKTRKAIKEALLTLIPIKGYDRITVQDIADEAMINRNTFYLHYMDKPDLMEKLSQECLEILNDSLASEITNLQEINKSVFTAIFKKMFLSIKSDIRLYRTMLGDNGQLSFSSRLKDVLRNHILNGAALPIHDKKKVLGLEYIISGLVGVICLWISDPEPLSIDEISEQLSDIHFNNFVHL